MSALTIVARLIGHFVRSEFASRVAKHIVRDATVELVRHVRRHTRGSSRVQDMR